MVENWRSYQSLNYQGQALFICAFVSSSRLLARRLIFYILSSPQLRNKLFSVDFPVFSLQQHIKDERFERSGNPLNLLVIRLIYNR